MRILVSNDDGYLAPGLAALAGAMRPFGTVTVVAPEQNSSGASNSLTLSRPLTVSTAPDGVIYINGTPSDCVHIALTGLLEQRPDLIVSGINNGQNMGDDTIYSGTVAAAMEGFLFGVPSMAFSLVDKGYEHLDTAAAMAAEVVRRHLERPLPGPFLLNVNVPNRPLGDIKGIAPRALANAIRRSRSCCTQNPRGEPIYWIGPSGAPRRAGPVPTFTPRPKAMFR